MFPRRHLLLAATAIALAWQLPTLAPAQAADAASAFVGQTGQALVAAVNSDAPDAARKAQLAAVVERSVDIDGVARFCLGRFWRTATPAQQQEFTQLFHRVLIRSVTSHLGDYRGVTFTLNRSMPREGGTGVQSTVVRPGNPPNQVEWLVASGASPRIIDVIAEGTSLRLTQRDDYASFITRNGGNVQALIDAMRRQSGA